MDTMGMALEMEVCGFILGMDNSSHDTSGSAPPHSSLLGIFAATPATTNREFDQNSRTNE